jgi:predicted Zn-dependent protease
VLAHEIQHVVQRHATRALFRESSIRVLIAALTGNANGLAQALNAAGKLGGVRYQRGDEEAADRDGMKMLQAARIDPSGLIGFFRRLAQEEQSGPRIPAYLSTHPQTADRIQRLERLATQAHYTPVKLLPGYPWEEMKEVCR